jgi:hypothetical protein
MIGSMRKLLLGSMLASLALSASYTRAEQADGDSGSNLDYRSSRPAAGWKAPAGKVAPNVAPVSPFVEDDVAKPIQKPATVKYARRTSSSRSGQQPELVTSGASRSMRAGGDYAPDWQRLPPSFLAATIPTIAGNGSNRRAAHQMMAQPGPMGGGPSPRPFAEDGEVVPPPQAMLGDGHVQYQNAPVYAQGDDGVIADGGDMSGSGMGGCGETCSGDGCGEDGCSCGECACDPMACERFYVCGPWSFLNETAFTSGVAGFKSPIDNGSNGNFGYSVGANTGDAIWHRRGIGYQIGANLVESNLYGDQANGFNPGNRRQVFATAGLFHRAFYGRGWQGGVVIDYQSNRYYVNYELYQLRSELSYVFANGQEIGFMGTNRATSQRIIINNAFAHVRPINMYAGFYRWNAANGGNIRVWFGATEPISASYPVANTAFVFGAEYRMPLTNRVDFTGGFNSLLPTQSGIAGQTAESWGLNVNLVFYPARFCRGIHNGPYRPLFNVANNNNFMVDQYFAP